jgi:hypothetical protein
MIRDQNSRCAFVEGFAGSHDGIARVLLVFPFDFIVGHREPVRAAPVRYWLPTPVGVRAAAFFFLRDSFPAQATEQSFLAFPQSRLAKKDLSIRIAKISLR